MGTVVNRALTSIPRGSLRLILTVPLRMIFRYWVAVWEATCYFPVSKDFVKKKNLLRYTTKFSVQ